MTLFWLFCFVLNYEAVLRELSPRLVLRLNVKSTTSLSADPALLQIVILLPWGSPL